MRIARYERPPLVARGRCCSRGGQLGELALIGIHVEVVTPLVDLAVVTHVEDAGDGKFEPAAADLETVEPLVDDHRADLVLAQDLPLDRFGWAEEHVQRGGHAFVSDDRVGWHVVIGDVGRRERNSRVNILALDGLHELGDGL